MAIESWIAFVLASAVLVAIPGPTILTVISYSMTHGRRARLPLITAVAFGDATALVLSLIGLGAVLTTSAWLFSAIKWIGGLYLIYLGVRMLRAGTTSIVVNPVVKPAGLSEPDTQSVGPLPAESPWRLFANTWLVTALNPKGIIFFVAFLPQFIDSSVPVVPQLWLLSITFVCVATLNATLYTNFAIRACSFLASPQAQRRFNLGGGGLLAVAGGWALTARQTT